MPGALLQPLTCDSHSPVLPTQSWGICQEESSENSMFAVISVYSSIHNMVQNMRETAGVLTREEAEELGTGDR